MVAVEEFDDTMRIFARCLLSIGHCMFTEAAVGRILNISHARTVACLTLARNRYGLCALAEGVRVPHMVSAKWWYVDWAHFVNKLKLQTAKWLSSAMVANEREDEWQCDNAACGAIFTGFDAQALFATPDGRGACLKCALGVVQMRVGKPGTGLHAVKQRFLPYERLLHALPETAPVPTDLFFDLRETAHLTDVRERAKAKKATAGEEEEDDGLCVRDVGGVFARDVGEGRDGSATAKEEKEEKGKEDANSFSDTLARIESAVFGEAVMCEVVASGDADVGADEWDECDDEDEEDFMSP